MSDCLRQNWSRSKTFRVILLVAFLYLGVRTAVQVYATIISPRGTGQSESPLPVDFQIYLDTANRFQLRQSLYPEKVPQSSLLYYEYSPFYAMTFIPFLWLPTYLQVPVFMLLHFVGYGLLYVWWGRIFYRMGLHKAGEMLAWTLPLWIAFKAFWIDLYVLNNYMIMALFATLLLEAVLDERLGWSFVWLSVIIQIKPQWAFAAALPLFLGRWRFFFKLLALAIVGYAAVIGATMLMAGFSYGWQQYKDYVLQMWDYHYVFPWRGPEAKYLGYGHSIAQIAFYFLGVTPTVQLLVQSIKVLLLAPLAALLLRPTRRAGYDTPQRSLDLVFALYLGIFIWLDVVVELSLGIVVFIYLLATLERRSAKILIWVVFLFYALDDLWNLISYAIFGESIIFAGDKVVGMMFVTSPNIYIPTLMIILLTFYALLIRRLWVNMPMRGLRGT